jgi:hypothetical protein
VNAGGHERAHRSPRERLARWAAELRQQGLAEALRARLRRDAGTTELAGSVAVHYEAANRRLDWLEQQAAIGPVMTWIEHATLATNPLISVIMPTRNRSGLLPRAIASVLAQTYPDFELVVIDDGSSDDTAELLASISDRRLRPLRIDHSGVGAARNAGLEAATGELIAYLDDDNLMHPGWLKSVAWAFEQRPEAQVAYGAIVIDDVNRGDEGLSATMPQAYVNQFDRQRLGEDNLADISAIAHRAGLPQARFDEGLVTMADWDLLARLCAERDPVVLPAIACLYTTDAPGRLTGGPTQADDTETVRDRVRDARNGL